MIPVRTPLPRCGAGAAASQAVDGPQTGDDVSVAPLPQALPSGAPDGGGGPA